MPRTLIALAFLPLLPSGQANRPKVRSFIAIMDRER